MKLTNVLLLTLITGTLAININAMDATGQLFKLLNTSPETSITKEEVLAAIENGADLNATNFYCQTHLIVAAGSGHREACIALIENGANVKASTTEYGGFTALHAAAEKGHEDVCELLIQNGAELDKTFSQQRLTPLHKALINGHTEASIALIDGKANVNAQASEEYDRFRTPLHIAVQKELLEVCKRLIDERASVLAKTDNGDTALDYVENVETCELLLLPMLLNSFSLDEKVEAHLLMKVLHSCFQNAGIPLDVQKIIISKIEPLQKYILIATLSNLYNIGTLPRSYPIQQSGIDSNLPVRFKKSLKRTRERLGNHYTNVKLLVDETTIASTLLRLIDEKTKMRRVEIIT